MSMRKHGWRCPTCNRKPTQKVVCENCGYDRLAPAIERWKKLGLRREADRLESEITEGR